MEHSTRKSPLLSVQDLNVTFATQDGDVTAVNKLNFELSAGKLWELWVSPVRVNPKPPLL